MTSHSRSRSRSRKRRASPASKDGFVEVRASNGRLLCRFDPQRELIEIKPKGDQPVVVDLRKLRAVD